MIRSRALVCLAVVISLLLGVIWPNPAVAAVAPEIVPLGAIEAGLTVPGKLDVDAAGNLYIADIRGGKVLKFNASGDLLRSYDTVVASGRGLAVKPDGSRIFVATDDQVVTLDSQTGEVVGQIDMAGAGGIDLDATGNLYVVDFANVQVRVFDNAGNFKFAFSGYGTANGQFRSIDAMRVNVATSEVYVVGLKPLNANDDWVDVQMFSLDGSYKGSLTQVGERMYTGGGVTFDAADREYYLDKLTGKLHVKPQSTGFDPVIYNISGTGAGQVVQPWDITFDPLTSRLFVPSDSGEIEIFGVDGGTTPEKNSAPGLPTPIDPIANSIVDSLQPQLGFANASDLNGDSLVYEVQIFGSPSLTYTVNEDASGTTVVIPDRELSENEVYTWQVMARDGELDSGWAPAETFYVDAIAEAPSAPVLSSALGGNSLGGAGLLKWEPSIDDDPLDVVTYRLEISPDDSFDTPLVVENLAEHEISLGALKDYDALLPGNIYFWRVTAVDSDGLATVSEKTGRFVYETAMLSVTSNLPDARVYFGGNAAYPGSFVGTTPLELRDLASGPYTVVVERAGCEPFIAQVELGPAGTVNINANLLLAIEPELKDPSALRSVKSQLQSAALVAPFVVDFDNDGLDDLLVGDQDGNVNLFRALARRGAKVQYGAAESLDFGQLPDTALSVVDWNNDNRKDVLVGAADGTVSIYLQGDDSSDLSPVYTFPLFLRNGAGSVIDVGSQANPAVVDFDNDGNKDLVLGTGNGEVFLYRNKGDDAAPKLAVEAELLMKVDGSATPLFVDWDADGVRDLLISSSGSLKRYAKKDDESYAVAEVIVDADAYGIAEGARFFVVDADNSQGKDVYVGQADGLVQVMRSNGKEFLPAVTTALLDKLSQISEMAPAGELDINAEIEAVKSALEAEDFKAAERGCRKLAAASRSDSVMYDAAVELVALLNQ